MTPVFRSAALGLLTGLLTLTPAAPLTPLTLAAWFAEAARAARPGRAMFAGGFFYVGAHLWWVMGLTFNIFGTPAAAPLAWVLYAAEGAFLGILGLTAARAATPEKRLGILAGGWVILEWLRGLGPLAFPWPIIGVSWLDTPFIQVADLGGALLVSLLITSLAAALAWAWLRRGAKPLLLAALPLLLALGYGLTRQPGAGPMAAATVVRSDVDSFHPQMTRAEEIADLYRASLAARRQPDEAVLWPETMLPLSPAGLAAFPAPGLSGFGAEMGEAPTNKVLALDAAGKVVGENAKGKPVPFGEYFPFSGIAAPLYDAISGLTGFNLSQSIIPARRLQVLQLDGVIYGAYICYDSVFGWPARQLANQGAEVLVNLSNDSWFFSAGVRQHFNLGRLRAIETRRWVLRSVQRGFAGSVDDLGRPQALLTAGPGGGLSVEYRKLTGRTLYMQLGDWPALAAAAALAAWGLLRPRKLKSRCWRTHSHQIRNKGRADEDSFSCQNYSRIQ